MLHNFLDTKIVETDEVLDIGCGIRTYSRYKCSKIIGVDGWEKVNPDILLDCNKEKLPFSENSFDVILLIDFIEHLDKDQGWRIINESKNISRKNIILMTPLWWTENKENTENPNLWCYKNPFNYHKSLWSVDEFISVGFTRVNTIGTELENYFLGIWEKYNEF